MELYHLRTFVTVAREGRLAGAAERLFTSVPSVSAHIKSLEAEIGVPLFTRTPKGMALTEAGKALVPHAQEAIKSAEGFLLQAQSLREEIRGEARLGINTDSVFLRAMDICRTLREQHPGLDLQMLKTLTIRTADMLRGRQLDGGFVYGERHAADMGVVHVGRAPLRIVFPIDWAERIRNAQWPDIAALPWIWVTQDCPLFASCEGVFANSGLRPNIAMRTDDEATLLDLVRSGHGATLLRADEAQAASERGQVLLWDEIFDGPPVCFLYWRHREQDRLVQALLQAVLKVWGAAPPSPAAT